MIGTSLMPGPLLPGPLLPGPLGAPPWERWKIGLTWREALRPGAWIEDAMNTAPPSTRLKKGTLRKAVHDGRLAVAEKRPTENLYRLDDVAAVWPEAAPYLERAFEPERARPEA